MNAATDKLMIAPGLELPADCLAFRFDRSGGPGGQNVNKVNTQATLTVPLVALEEMLTESTMQRLREKAGRWLAEDRLVIASSASRSQLANRKACLAKLRQLILEAMHRPRRRIPTRPGRGAIESRLRSKQQRGQRKAARRFDRNPGSE